VTRNEKILARIDPRTGRGLEIGPLTSPVLAKSTADVVYVDRASRDELVQWFSTNPKLDTSAILEVDCVWGDRTLSECVGGATFDFCIASHVMEHVPDLVTWLHEVHAVLRDGGILSVALPDQRYMFDCLRPLSTPADVVDAYVNRRRRPSARQIYEHFSQIVEVDAAALWRHRATGEDLEVRAPGGSRELLAICEDAQINAKYIDSHCWIFTPDAFVRTCGELAALGLMPFEIAEFFPTAENDAEFFASLRKLPDGMSAAEQAARFRASAESRNPGTAEPKNLRTTRLDDARGALSDCRRAESQNANRAADLEAELAIMKRSKSWRLTAPLRALGRALRRSRR
jgi:SAM-dependent methyltransferase